MKLLDVLNSPWAIVPDKLDEIRDVYLTRLNNEKVDLKALEAELGRPLGSQLEASVVNGVAVIPIEGVIAKRMNMFSNISGGTSLDLVENAFHKALDNEDVHTIALHIDSPGGTVAGTQEFAQLVFNSRSEKRIVAVVDGLMASAALWIGTAASEVFITGDTSQVGSIGVIATHVDISEKNKMEGISTTEITSGKFKAITSENRPLSEEGHKVIQSHVDELFSIFVRDVAEFRDIEVDVLLDGIADGRMFIGQKAIKNGLVDGVQPFRSLITQLASENGDSLSVTANSNEEGDLDMEAKAFSSVADLQAVYPDLVNEIKSEANIEGIATGKKEELERIKAVESNALEGHESLIEKLKFDGVTSGAEAAQAVLNAEKKITAQAKTDLDEGATEPAPQVSDATSDRDVDLESMSITERAECMWDTNADKVRDIYLSKEQFVAFYEADSEGMLKIKNG
jgi:capsid assembly protease